MACPTTITSLTVALDYIHVTWQFLCVFTGGSDGSVERNLGEWSLHLDLTASIQTESHASSEDEFDCSRRNSPLNTGERLKLSVSVEETHDNVLKFESTLHLENLWND